ncbi:MAG: COX15/CtaA family protein [Paracoccaceae bacterium]
MLISTNKNLHPYNNTSVNYWLFGLLFLLLFMILIGGLTRLTDSGLSITNWEPILGAIPPLTNSDWILSFQQYKLTNEFKLQNFQMSISDFKVIYWWEWGHRQFGRIIGLFWFFGFLYFLISTKLPIFFKISFFVLGFLGLTQAFIGWWMVQSGLNNEKNLLDVASYRLAIHLNLALIIVSFIFLLIKINNHWFQKISLLTFFSNFSIEKFLIGLFIIFVFCQITLGAFVSGIDAGKSYNEWPLMNNNFVPEDYLSLEPYYQNFLENPATVQFNHRIMGYFIFVFSVFIWIKHRLNPDQNQTIKKDYNILILLVFTQVFVGIFAVIYAVPISLGVIHQLSAVFLLLAGINLWFNLFLYK